MRKDTRDAPALTPSATPPKNERRRAQTLTRHFDRETSTVETRAEAQQRYRDLGLRLESPAALDYYDFE
jgi:hypothetical protein